VERQILIYAFAIGCGGGMVAPAMPAAPSLTRPLEVTTTQLKSDSSVAVTVSSWREGSAQSIAFSPSDLVMKVHTGERPRLDALELPLGNVDIGAGALPPSGLKLRDLSLGIDGAVDAQAESTSDDMVKLHVTAPLRLAWSVELADGTVHALGPAVTEPLAFDIELERKGAAVTTSLSASCPDTCWTIDGLARLDGGQVHLAGDATLTPPR
jgi:hypothetical protein